ncbi:MAG: hypothetical protein EBS06_01165 [Proteobacteria bacterium]|nr:hypothetical protein [Pseudomonadota bacterium]
MKIRQDNILVRQDNILVGNIGYIGWMLILHNSNYEESETTKRGKPLPLSIILSYSEESGFKTELELDGPWAL